MKTIKVIETYRGQEGLFIAGHIYSLTPGQIAAIQDDCARQGKEFKYAPVKDAANFNKAARTPENKQQEGDQNK